MLCYSDLCSHPNKKLETHLYNVAIKSKNIFNNLALDNKDFYKDFAFKIGLCHDFAKSTSFFQDKLNGLTNTKKANHSFLSAVFGYYVIKKFYDGKDLDFDFPSIAFIVILRHHGNLKNISLGPSSIRANLENVYVEYQLDDIKKNFNSMDKTLKKFYMKYDINIEEFVEDYSKIIFDLRKDLLKLSLSNNIDYYLIILLFYSVLLDADKMDASATYAFERIDLSETIVDDFKNDRFNSSDGINSVREEAYQEVTDNILNHSLSNRIFSIDLPTGAGKTLTAFSAALKLRKKISEEFHFYPRIIYSLPFLSIIDQNEKVFADVLSNSLESINVELGTNILLKHNYLSDMSYKVDCNFLDTLLCNKKHTVPINNSRILIEGWNSEIVITTFIQFFFSLIGNRNRSLRKFHNMVNSIIILDEIQAVPYKYWKVLNIVLSNFAKKYNSWIILMTATQPLIFDEKEIIPLVDNRSYYYTKFDRIDYFFDLEKIEFSNFKMNMINEIETNSSKDYMFILNTIKSSKDLYDYFKKYFYDKGCQVRVDISNGIVHIDENTQLIYLSTNIIPKHRLNRINQVNPNKRNIIITTQLVEAGVDISVDVIYRDLAPLDSIIQAAGRCNRNSCGKRGKVNVVYLLDDSKENKKSFCSYVYNSVLINATVDLLNDFVKRFKGLSISEKDFNLTASKDYYLKLIDYGSDEPSDMLIKILNKLNFSEIPKEFKLIESNIEKQDVFIEVDEEAKELWEKFINIQSEENSIKRKDEFSKIKSKFYEYVVSISVKDLGTTLVDNWMGYISFDDCNRKYAIETGFLPSDKSLHL